MIWWFTQKLVIERYFWVYGHVTQLFLNRDRSFSAGLDARLELYAKNLMWNEIFFWIVLFPLLNLCVIWISLGAFLKSETSIWNWLGFVFNVAFANVFLYFLKRSLLKSITKNLLLFPDDWKNWIQGKPEVKHAWFKTKRRDLICVMYENGEFEELQFEN